MKTKVYMIRMGIYMAVDIPALDIQEAVTKFLDNGLSVNPQFAKLHEENKYKYYCYDNPYPIPEDKVYRQNQIYTLTIRTVDVNLARYFSENVVNTYTRQLKGLNAQVRIIPQKQLDILYTLTPAILKCNSGYWQDEMTVMEYEERLKVNLIKKWNQFHGEKIPEDFGLFTGVEFLNKCPVVSKYKGVKLLGDKVRIHVSDNERAQQLAYLALGTGVLEMNSRGYGFVTYRWL